MSAGGLKLFSAEGHPEGTHMLGARLSPGAYPSEIGTIHSR